MERELPPSDRTGAMILAGNYGEASAFQFYGRGLPRSSAGISAGSTGIPRDCPQRFVLTVGYDAPACNSSAAAGRRSRSIDNRWHLDNEERGRLIAACALKHRCAQTGVGSIASDRL